jgi:hypothetical protein
MLTTDVTPQVAPNDPSSLHSASVADAVTPLDSNNAPTFDPVWSYLCFK